jgi:hypothetical protein
VTRAVVTIALVAPRVGSAKERSGGRQSQL